MHPTPDPIGAALLARALASPDADEPRLAYADWCEEAGRTEEARRYRLQLALTCAGLPDTGAVANAQRDLDPEEIDPGLARELGTFRVALEYRRGLPWGIEVRSMHARKEGRWAALVRSLAERFPTIERAAFTGVWNVRRYAGDEIAVQLGAWSRLSGLVLHGLAPSASGWRALAELPGLTRLDLENDLFGAEEAAGLSLLTRLERLLLRQAPEVRLLPNGFGYQPMGWNVAMPVRALRGLRALHLVGFGPESWGPLASLERLEHLSLPVPARDASAIEGLPLRSLELVLHRDADLDAVPALDRLQHLGLSHVRPGRGRWTRQLGRFPALVSLAFETGDLQSEHAGRVARYVPGLIRFATNARVTPELVADLARLPKLAAVRLGSAIWDEGAIARIGLLAGPRAIDLDPVALDDDRIGRVLAGIGVSALHLSSPMTVRSLTEARLRAIAGPTLEQLVLRGRWRIQAPGELVRRYLPALRLLWADELPGEQVVALARAAELGLAIGNPTRWRARVAHPGARAWAPLPEWGLEDGALRGIGDEVVVRPGTLGRE